jgi:hypothetical protein
MTERTPAGLVALLLLSAPASRLSAQGLAACEHPKAVKAALDALPSDPTPQQTEKSFSEQKLEKIQALLREYPGDLFVERAQIDLVGFGSPERDKLIEQYKNLSAKNPGDPKLLYLYGLTLMGRQTPQAIKLFEGAIAKDGKFAWPHLALAGIYTSRNFSNKEKAAAQAKSFLELCPASLEGYEQLTQMDNRELLTASAQKLRKQIETRSDPDAVGAYKTLWSLEFKAHPPSEYEPLRKQAAGDLERLRALKLEDTRQWYEALEEGYKLVNDQKQSDWAKDERLRRFPTMWELAARDNWSKDHPWPGADDPAEKQQAFYSDLLKQTGEWLKERPNTTYMWEQRLEAMKHLDVPPAEVEATAAEVLKVGEANAGPLGTDSNVYFTAAEALLKKKLEPARVVELVDKGLAQWEVESRQPHSDLWSSKDNIENMNFYRAAGRVEALTFNTRAHLQLGQTRDASADIEQIGQRLPELKSLAGTKDDRLKEYATRQAAHWELMARLAEAGNHKLDAMAYYQTALLTRLQAGVKPPADEKDELALDTQKLWTGLGGSEQGWQMWYARPAAELAAKSTLTWEKANEPLPEIALADIQGKTWHLSDLKGKVVLLNVWASW